MRVVKKYYAAFGPFEDTATSLYYKRFEQAHARPLGANGTSQQSFA